MAEFSGGTQEAPWWMDAGAHGEKVAAETEMAHVRRSGSRNKSAPLLVLASVGVAVAASMFASSAVVALVASATILGVILFKFLPTVARTSNEPVVQQRADRTPTFRRHSSLRLLEGMKTPVLTPTSACYHHYYMASPWKPRVSPTKLGLTPDSAASERSTPCGRTPLWGSGIILDGCTVLKVEAVSAEMVTPGDELVTVDQFPVNDKTLAKALSTTTGNDRLRLRFRRKSGEYHRIAVVRHHQFSWDTLDSEEKTEVVKEAKRLDPVEPHEQTPREACGFCSLEQGPLTMLEISLMERSIKPCNFCKPCKEFD